MNEGQWEEQIINEVELPAEFAHHPAMAPVYGCPYYIVRATYRRYGGWYDGNPSHLKSSRTADIAKEVVVLAGADALLKRAEILIGNGNAQLALHLMDYVLDSGAEKDLKVQALQMKSTALKQLAEAETSFISRSILFNGSLTAAESAQKLVDGYKNE
jgi:alkyl sulfatase BDS1-like metallo-beta-lactamase superfamily hydrolase